MKKILVEKFILEQYVEESYFDTIEEAVKFAEQEMAEYPDWEIGQRMIGGSRTGLCLEWYSTNHAEDEAIETDIVVHLL